VQKKSGELLLVYEMMPNGSLDKHLYSTSNTALLPWPLRHEIVLGLGSALLYLHKEWEQCVVHRDIKPSNVMLDTSFHAKLGDFGLARLVDLDRGSHTTVLAGTMGYMDPECLITGKANAETSTAWHRPPGDHLRQAASSGLPRGRRRDSHRTVGVGVLRQGSHPRSRRRKAVG